jgi:tRNA G46 methylase TrmB
MYANSRNIDTNQAGPHEGLEALVQRHLAHPFRKPIADHTQQAFEAANAAVAGRGQPVILDSCCGVGDSSRWLAKAHPDHLIVGVDKSAKRLATERLDNEPENMLLLRADLNDFFRLVAAANWPVAKHYILYPNPWPKSTHLARRWHGAPVFPDIVKIGGALELRSNWKLYLEEFAIALKVAKVEAEVYPFEPDEYVTPFERKYHQSGQSLWQLTANLHKD